MNEHPEFEALSAFVDGEASQWRRHVDACDLCLADVARLRAVRAAIGQPVPPVADDVKERSIARALDAFIPSPASAVAESGDTRTPRVAGTPRVRPLPPVEDRPHVVAPPAPRRRVNGPWVALGSVAAVLLAVVVGAAVLRGPGGGGEGTQTLASGTPDSTAESGAAAPGYDLRQSSPAGAGGVTGPDLGPIDDAAQLAAKAGSGVRATERAASAPTPAPALAPGAALDSSVAGVAGTSVGTRPCEEQVRTARPELREVVYFATATTGGRPAFVLGFATGPDPAPVTLLLVAQEGCGVVAEASLP